MNSRSEGWACLVPCGLLVKVHTDPGICLSATRIATYQEHLVNCQPQECFVGSRGWERLADPFEAELSRPNMRPCSWNIAISNVKHECDLCQDCGEVHGLAAAVNLARNYSSSYSYSSSSRPRMPCRTPEASSTPNISTIDIFYPCVLSFTFARLSVVQRFHGMHQICQTAL